MRRSARPSKPAAPKFSAARAASPSFSELSVTLKTPSVSPTPDVPHRLHATPGSAAEGRPKRPMNAFILFSNEKRAELADQNPHLSNAAVSVLLGQRWREMHSGEKSGYVSAAKRIKEDFHAQHPDAKTRCVSRKGKRAKLDHNGAGRIARSMTPPSLHALALVGSRLNIHEIGFPSAEGKCDTASVYTQRAPSSAGAPSRPAYDDDDDDYDDDDSLDEGLAPAPSSESPLSHSAASPASAGFGYQPSLLEQLCTVAENEHTAAAHMLSAFGAH